MATSGDVYSLSALYNHATYSTTVDTGRSELNALQLPPVLGFTTLEKMKSV